MKFLKCATLTVMVMMTYFQGKSQRIGHVEFGIKTSPLLSWIGCNSDNIEGNGGRIGFSYGVMGDFYFTRRYAFATEFSITSLGGNIERTQKDASGNVISTTDAKYRINYVEIPLTLKLKSNEQNKMSFFGQFGFVPGVKTNAKIKGTSYNEISGNTTDIGKDGSFGPTGDAAALRFGLLIGGGVYYNFVNDMKLYGGLSLNQGITNAFKNSSGMKGTTSALTLNLGMYF